MLARFNPHWASTAAAQDPDILRIDDSENLYVAHELARYQSGWGLTAIAKNTNKTDDPEPGATDLTPLY